METQNQPEEPQRREWKTALEDQGFVILRQVFEEDRLEPCRCMADRIFSASAFQQSDPFAQYYLGHRTDNGVLYDLYQRHPEFRDLAQDPRILDALETVLGPDIVLYVNSLIAKPKETENSVPWHQDFGKRIGEPTKYIAWIALDNSTRENGCLKVIPGSHKRGFLPHVTIPGETHHDRVDPNLIDGEQAVDVELAAGDVVIFNMLLLHSSEQADADVPRRGYRIAYQGVDVSTVVPRGGPIVLRGGTPESLATVAGAGCDHSEDNDDSYQHRGKCVKEEDVARSRPATVPESGRASLGSQSIERLKEYRAILAARPDDPDAIRECGRLLISLGKSETAREMWAAYLTRHPADAGVRLLLEELDGPTSAMPAL